LSGGAPLLSDDEREVEYYLVSIGFNLFPGEAFVTDSTTFNTVFYLSGGVGNTTFAGDDRFTIAYAVGFRTLYADGFSVDIEMRDLIFEQDLFGTDETTNNLEFSVALNLFF
jgi:outer membrane beta-barrel protein